MATFFEITFTCISSSTFFIPIAFVEPYLFINLLFKIGPMPSILSRREDFREFSFDCRFAFMANLCASSLAFIKNL